MSSDVPMLSKLIDNIINNALLIKLGQKTKMFILHRVQRGIYFNDLNSDAAAPHNYSTKPMPVPYGLIVKKFGKSIVRKNRKIKGIETDSSEFAVRKINGKTMVIIKGGYNRYRQLMQKTDGNVVEHWSGRMMRNLGILRTEKNSVVLGFSNAEEEQKAIWQHVGAGKNKVQHVFMKLTKKEIEELSVDFTNFFVSKLK